MMKCTNMNLERSITKLQPKAIIYSPQDHRHLKYFVEHGVDITDDDTLVKNLGYLKDIHYGWRKGLELLGYNVLFIDRPSYLVPSFLRRVLPRIYIKFLRFTRIPGIKQIDSILHYIHIYSIIREHSPKFLYIVNEELSKWLINACRKHGCDTIEYHGTIAALRTRRHHENVTKHVDYIISGFNLPPLLDFDIRNKFHQIDIGVDPDIYGEIIFDKGRRPIDICAIGRYNDYVFGFRSRIINDFLRTDLTQRFSIVIGGFALFKEDSNYEYLKQKLTGPIYGQDYINTLKSSKMSIVIPSDDHIKAGKGMPLRIFQNAAAGCMSLVYNCDAVNVFKPKDEIVLFDDVDDLVEKSKYYIEHDNERMHIARNARDHFLEEYTAQKQIQKVIRKIYEDRE